MERGRERAQHFAEAVAFASVSPQVVVSAVEESEVSRTTVLLWLITGKALTNVRGTGGRGGVGSMQRISNQTKRGAVRRLGTAHTAYRAYRNEFAALAAPMCRRR